jgi:hypothetical protein
VHSDEIAVVAEPQLRSINRKVGHRVRHERRFRKRGGQLGALHRYRALRGRRYDPVRSRKNGASSSGTSGIGLAGLGGAIGEEESIQREGTIGEIIQLHILDLIGPVVEVVGPRRVQNLGDDEAFRGRAVRKGKLGLLAPVANQVADVTHL